MDTATTIERSLTRDILRGHYAAGSRLPTLRELGLAFSVNPSTMQRVIAALEARGLVTARQGSGLRVNDPREVGDLSLIPLWIEATLDDPARATSLLEELLELRRAVAVRLIVRHRQRLLDALPTLGGALDGALRATQTGAGAMREADLAFARALVAATGNTVALTVFNAVASAVVEVPSVAEAMYADPAANVASLMEVVQAIQGGCDDLADVVEGAIAKVDARTVARFDASLRSQTGAFA